MKLKNLKITKFIILAFVNSVFAMEPDKEEIDLATVWGYIQSTFEMYQSSRICMIAELNGLLILGEIDEHNQEKALSIAKGLGAKHLAQRIENYQKEDRTVNYLETLPPEIISEIMNYVISDGGNGRLSTDTHTYGIKDLLIVNKSFSANLLATPVHINLENYRGKNPTEALERLINLFPNMRSLDFGFFRNINKDSVIHLGKLTNLTSLRLSVDFEIPDVSLQLLAPMTKLTHLYLRNGNFPNLEITDVGVQSLTSLTQLRFLQLDHFAIMDAQLLFLNSLTNLTSLDLCWFKITQAGLPSLAPLTQITSLRIYEKITDVKKERLQQLFPGLVHTPW